MKILLISGHGATDPGAIGIDGVQERTLTRKITKRLKEVLAGYADVTIYPTERNAYADVKNGVFTQFTSPSKYDYVLEIHMNASNGKGHGSEIYITSSEKGHSVEDSIMKQIEGVGFKNRGVKVKNFLVINYVKKKGISSALLETCFIDNVDDMKLFNTKFESVVNAIAIGIIQGFKLDAKNQKKPPTPHYEDDFYPKYNGKSGSIVEALTSIGVDASFTHRKKIAHANGILNYSGTSTQNIRLLDFLKKGKLKRG